MKRLLLSLLLTFSLSLSYGQCPGSLSCEGAGVLCSIDALNGFMCSNPIVPNTDFPTGDLCRGVGVPHNLNWWAFVGNGAALNLTFNFNPGDCETGQGIQAGVFEGTCDGAAIWDCNASCNTSNFTLSGATKKCEIYYVWVDGCNGDVCQYTMSVNGGGGPPMLQRPMPMLQIMGRPCACGEVDVCFPGYADGCDPTFQWTVDGIPTGGEDDDCVTIMIPENASPTMPVVVCMTATIGNPRDPNTICDQDFTCINVIPEPPDQHFGPCKVICFEDQPYVWQGATIFSSCIMPPCSVRVQGPDGCCIDSLRQFILRPPSQLGLLDTFVCFKPPLGAPVQVGNEFFTQDVCGDIVEWQKTVINPTCPTDIVMCDTSAIVNIRFFDYKPDWEFECETCSGGVTIRANVEYDPDCPSFNDGQVTIMLNWFNQLTGVKYGVTDGFGSIFVNEAGTYCVDVTASFRGKSCMSLIPECFTIPPDLFPETPNLTGDSVICAELLGKYTVDFPPNVCDFFWEVRSGGGIIASPNSLDSSTITVDWTNRVGNSGLVCVKFTTDCGTSPDTCFVVEFLPRPMPDAGPDTVVCALTIDMSGTEDLGGMWTQLSGPSMANIISPTDIRSRVDVDRYGEFTFVWTESNLDCSASDSVTVLFRPDPEILELDTICSGDATEFTVRIVIGKGQAPYTIVSGGGTITNDSIYFSDLIPDNTPTTIVIRDAYGCEFAFFIDHDCVCGNAPGEMAMDTLKFCGPDEIACGTYDPTQQVLEPNDTFMYVLYSTVGMIQQTAIAVNQTGCFAFMPASMNLDQVYYIGVVVGRKDGNGEVDWNGGCLQIAEAQPVIWYTEPAPDAGPDDQICGQVINLGGVQSLVGKSTFRWLNTAGATIDSPNDLNTSVNVPTFGKFQFVLSETNGICTTTDTVEIEFNDSPDGAPEEICVDFVNFEFIVTFTITGGTPPYTLITGTGSIDPMTNVYTSDNLPSLTPYTIVIEDSKGCQYVINDQHNCDCGNTDAGNMDGALDVCVDECVDICSNGSEIVQADEETFFVLHTGAGSIIQNEISRQVYDHMANPCDDKTFCFDAALMTPEVTYYISRLVRETGNTEDPCERVSPGQPVTWHNYPNADAGPDEDVCGFDAFLSATPSLGQGGWLLLSGPGNAVFADSMPVAMLTVDAYGTYQFIWREQNYDCANTDTVEITFHDAPIVSNVRFECDDVAENYRIIFEVNEGEMATWNVTNLPNVTQNGNVYTSDWIPTGGPASFCVTDQWNCAPSCVDTSFVCDCITEPGTVLSDDILCIDECVQANYNGGVTDPNDVIRYVLHDGDVATVGTIIECNDNGMFCFDQFAMMPNTTYYITVMVGNSDGSGCVDITDRCFGQSPGVPVTWFEYPVPSIDQSEPRFTCEVDSMILDGFSSTGPGSLNYLWTTLDGSFCASADVNSANVWICSGGTYILTVTHAESGCATSDTITIDVDENIPNVNSGNPQELTCDVTMVTLDGTGTDFGGDFEVTWLDPQMNPIGNGLVITVSEPGIYTIFVNNAVTNCDNQATVEVTQNILPPTAIIDQIGTLTCIVDQVSLDGSGSQTQGGIRDFEWSTTTGEIIGSTTGSTVDVSEAGNYQLIITDTRNGCKDTIDVDVEEIGNTLVSLDIDAKPPSCNGDNNAEIDILGVNGGFNPYEFSINNGPFGSADLFRNLSPGDYEITVRDMNGCEKDTIINIPVTPPISIEAKEDQFIEAGSDIDADTLILQVLGVNQADADSIVWYNNETGERLGVWPNVPSLDSLLRTTTLRVELWNNGCFEQDLINIFVKFTKRIYIPNVITPGGSGTGENDKLYIFGNKDRIKEIKFLRVYDRWGELIYSLDDVPYDERLGRSTEGWDGIFNGELLNPAVFVYHTQIEFYGGAIQDYSGDVTILGQTP